MTGIRCTTRDGQSGAVIILPEDFTEQERQAFVRKLEEYRERLAGEIAAIPGGSEILFPDEVYKIAILEALLANGLVATADIKRRYDGPFQRFEERVFENACCVIARYVELRRPALV